MKIFISWSGHASLQIARKLYTWLPVVLSGNVTCFMSDEDIEAGERGLSRIADELESSQFGIAVITPENVHKPWINFEAGAISKAVGESKLIPLRLSLTAAEVTGPLSVFQSMQVENREEIFKLVKEIACAFENLPTETVETVFEARWPELEEVISKASEKTQAAKPRPVNSMIEELLELVRGLSKREARTADTLSKLVSLSGSRDSNIPYPYKEPGYLDLRQGGAAISLLEKLSQQLGPAPRRATPQTPEDDPGASSTASPSKPADVAKDEAGDKERAGTETEELS